MPWKLVLHGQLDEWPGVNQGTAKKLCKILSITVVKAHRCILTSITLWVVLFYFFPINSLTTCENKSSILAATSVMPHEVRLVYSSLLCYRHRHNEGFINSGLHLIFLFLYKSPVHSLQHQITPFPAMYYGTERENVFQYILISAVTIAKNTDVTPN